MAGDAGPSFFAPFFPAIAGSPAGADTLFAEGWPAARHVASVDVRIPTVHRAGARRVPHQDQALRIGLFRSVAELQIRLLQERGPEQAGVRLNRRAEATATQPAAHILWT